MRVCKKTIKAILAIFMIITIITGCSNEIGRDLPTKANVIVQSDKKEDLAKGLKVHFIDVGQADSILIQQGNSAMLIDGGNNGDNEIIKSYLDKQDVKSLEYVIGTHVHEDHIGGLDYIINSFQIEKILFPRHTSTTKTFEDFIAAVKGKGLKFVTPNMGNTYKLGEATFTILAPNSAAYEDANNYSIVIKLQYGDSKFLLTGDAETVSEMEMLKKGLDLKADVLKVGHHGSKSSTSESFLKAVSPKYAIISVGKDNKYGHPEQITLDRLKNIGSKLYRTDKQGTIIAYSDGKEIRFNISSVSY